jgi:hypothetical protein
MRVRAEQVWPELRKHLPTPSATAFEALVVEVVEEDVGRLAAELEGDRLMVSAPSWRRACRRGWSR